MSVLPVEKNQVSQDRSASPHLEFAYVKPGSEHFPKLEEVFKSRIQPLYGAQDDTLGEIHSGSGKRCEALVEGSTPVGFLIYENQERGTQNSFFDLKNFFVVNPGGRDLDKYGTLLLNRSLKLARRCFVQTLRIAVSESDPHRDFLERNGFLTQTVDERVYPGGAKRFVYHKAVPESSRREDAPKERVEPTGRSSNHQAHRDRRSTGKRSREQDETADETGRSKAEKEAKRESIGLGNQDYRSHYDKPRFDDRRVNDSRYDRPYGDIGRASDGYEYNRPDSENRNRPPLDRTSSDSRIYERKPHQLTLKKKYIHQIKYYGKTIEGRINSGMISKFRTGDKIRFFYGHDPLDDAVCTITKISRYSGFKEMLETEGFKKCLTDVRSLDEAVRTYDSIPGYAERARKNGVLAIHLDLLKE